MGEGGGGVYLNHTDATGCHVSSHHDWALARLEFVEHPVALVLLLVAVDGEGWPAVLTKEAGDVVGHALRTCEDEDLVVLVLHNLIHVLRHAVALLEVGDDVDDLCDAMIGGQILRADVDLDEVLLVVGCKLTDILRPGGRPHASLTIWPDLTDDLTDLRLETHVKHTVGFVKYEVSDTAEVGLPRLQHIDEAAWRGNTDLYTTSKIPDLTTLGNTAVDAGVANARRLAEFADLLLDLNRKLTGRGQDEDDRSVTLRKEGLCVDVDDGRKAVREGLSRASLGNTDNVASRESHRPALGLNGCWVGEALRLDF